MQDDFTAVQFIDDDNWLWQIDVRCQFLTKPMTPGNRPPNGRYRTLLQPTYGGKQGK